MDGKYSKYIPSSYGFITKLEVVGDMLHVHTKETAKGEPHKYPLKETIAEFSGRLENQWRLIIEDKNLEIIKKDLTEDLLKKQKLGMAIMTTPVVLSCIYLGIAISAIASILVGLCGVTIIVATHLTAMNKIEKNFDEEMDMVRTYLSTRTDIEKMYQKDPNVTGNLKSTTISRIELNNELRKTNVVTENFDIMLLDDLMSKVTSKKELKKLLTNYMVCVALRQPQVFVNPHEERKDISEQEETLIVKIRGKCLNNTKK